LVGGVKGWHFELVRYTHPTPDSRCGLGYSGSSTDCVGSPTGESRGENLIMMRLSGFTLLFASLSASALADAPETLPKTERLAEHPDRSKAMLDGLHRFAERKIDESLQTRAKLWNRDTSSPDAYERSVRGNRESFQKKIGVVDARLPVTMERFGDDDAPALVAEGDSLRVYQVRWPVLEGIHGEGLLLEPKGAALGHVIALPDADQTPEQLAGLAPGVAPASQFARRLAAQGLRVIVPTLISRGIDVSGNPRIALTNQTHREWIYRQAYHMGRHVIGYEVQKVLAAVDWIKAQSGPGAKVGVAGYGEGGLIAFYAAGADPRIDAALVSGYFGPRQRVWAEPIYRNVWGLLHEFGDAEIATLIAPRGLVVEHSAGPHVDGPPATPKGRRGGAAAGTLGTPSVAEVSAEWQRIDGLLPAGFQKRSLVHGEAAAMHDFAGPEALRAFNELLGIRSTSEAADGPLTDRRKAFDPDARQRRQVKEMEDHVQRLLRGADATRNAFFLNQTTLIRTLAPRGERFRMFRVQEQSPQVFAREVAPLRQVLSEEVLGRIDDRALPANPRSRLVYDRPAWTGYEVLLDVHPDVFAWGVLLVPKGILRGERRPVVVCQHGRNGLPKDVIEGDNAAYHDFAARLAERGFITFAPHNPYRGEDLYRMLNRKGNPVKLSLFSFITAQHRQILGWLGTLSFVDPARIAFYGLSYGGETAVRVPPLLEGYCLSICSADFNDWARKVAATDSDYSFMFSIEWEMPYFNMGSTFNYAEMAYLMVPRPFMVERGHHDGVAPDEWVASEYGKVRWVYDNLGLADQTAIEFYNGGHTINGQGTFDFLHRHLRWPEAAGR
jgi:dienelactone hydrolase